MTPEAGIIAALNGRPPRFKVPKRVFFVEDPSRNSMGKVDQIPRWRDCRAYDVDGYAS
jgi:hypothetical protein